MTDEAPDDKDSFQHLQDQLKMYTEMCQDVFANVLNDDQ